MSSYHEKFMQVFESQKPWVLSLVEVDGTKSDNERAPASASFLRTVSPEFARWLMLEMTKPKKISFE